MRQSGVHRVLRRYAVLLLVVFAVLAVWERIAESWTVDRQTLVALHEGLGDRLDQPMEAIATLTDLAPLSAAAVAVVVVLLVARRFSDAGWFALAVSVVWLLNPLFKRLVARDRPDVRRLPDELSEYSFPSGHAADTMALGAALVMVVWCTRWRVPVLVGSALVIVLSGFAQLQLGRHHPVDIAAGWLWGVGWVLLVWSWRVSVSARSAAR